MYFFHFCISNNIFSCHFSKRMLLLFFLLSWEKGKDISIIMLLVFSIYIVLLNLTAFFNPSKGSMFHSIEFSLTTAYNTQHFMPEKQTKK